MEKKRKFIERFAQPVLNAVEGTTLFPSVMIAQAALESAWGTSSLSASFNNLFGIKADPSWKGRSVTMPTREYLNGKYVTIDDAFRAYDDPADSVRDRVKFLQDNPRYRQVFEAKTPSEQAQALQAAGYATDPQYASKIIATIKANDFRQWDLKKKQ